MQKILTDDIIKYKKELNFYDFNEQQNKNGCRLIVKFPKKENYYI